MNYDEFQRQLGKAGVTIREFATLIKMNSNSVTNYAKSGEVPSHLAVIAALLGEMAERKIDFREVLSKIEIEPKKPRGGGTGRFGVIKQEDLFVEGKKETDLPME
ncbi:XRE family transcriptional regulator [Methyloglobulus sp.]|uniref:XRE family transcriptional regulator n=1 Tax=Methyloglobulus sp. TaxID=2518622 RepID=UPI003989FA68